MTPPGNLPNGSFGGAVHASGFETSVSRVNWETGSSQCYKNLRRSSRETPRPQSQTKLRMLVCTTRGTSCLAALTDFAGCACTEGLAIELARTGWARVVLVCTAGTNEHWWCGDCVVQSDGEGDEELLGTEPAPAADVADATSRGSPRRDAGSPRDDRRRSSPARSARGHGRSHSRSRSRSPRRQRQRSRSPRSRRHGARRSMSRSRSPTRRRRGPWNRRHSPDRRRPFAPREGQWRDDGRDYRGRGRRHNDVGGERRRQPRLSSVVVPAGATRAANDDRSPSPADAAQPKTRAPIVTRRRRKGALASRDAGGSEASAITRRRSAVSLLSAALRESAASARTSPRVTCTAAAAGHPG